MVVGKVKDDDVNIELNQIEEKQKVIADQDVDGDDTENQNLNGDKDNDTKQSLFIDSDKKNPNFGKKSAEIQRMKTRSSEVVEQYCKEFFDSLKSYMGLLLLFNIGLGLYVFAEVFGSTNPDANDPEKYNMAPGLIFIMFAYPFIATNFVFIEIQQMVELLHDTKLDDNDDIYNESISNSLKMLSSNSAFWYIYGFTLNHYPMLYFMFKVASLIAYINILGFNLSYIATDDDDDVEELQPTEDTAELEPIPAPPWYQIVFEVTILSCYLLWQFCEPAFIKLMLRGYYDLYPPIKNPNIENVRPPNKPCSNEKLEKIKNHLIWCIQLLTPYSWLIEAVCYRYCVFSCFILQSGILLLLLMVLNMDMLHMALLVLSQYQIQIVVVVYMILGEKCCYTLGPEACCNQYLSCRKKESQCCSADCCVFVLKHAYVVQIIGIVGVLIIHHAVAVVLHVVL